MSFYGLHTKEITDIKYKLWAEPTNEVDSQGAATSLVGLISSGYRMPAGLSHGKFFIFKPAGELVLKKEIGPQDNIYRFEWEPGSEVPAGIYFVEVRTAQHFVRKKIIKI